MLHQAKELPPHATENAHALEEENFAKICKKVSLAEVPPSANILRSRKIYKIKERDDNARFCKARNAPHGNGDCGKAEPKTDSATCPPYGILL